MIAIAIRRFMHPPTPLKVVIGGLSQVYTGLLENKPKIDRCECMRTTLDISARPTFEH